MREFLQRNVIVLLLAGLFTLSAVGYGLTLTNHQNQLGAQKQTIAELEGRMRAGVSESEEEQRAVVNDALGTDAARVAEDTAAITEFLGTVTTWESGQEYVEARESVMRRYGLDPRSQFMSTYFQEPVYNTDSSGNRFYVVDAEGLNSSLASVDVKVLGVEGTAYRYMVLTEIASSSIDGKARATTTSVIYLTMDGEQVLSDVSGYASVAGARTSS